MLLINNSLILLDRQSTGSPFAGKAFNYLPHNTVILLWFLVLLLAFNLLYCSWVWLRGGPHIFTYAFLFFLGCKAGCKAPCHRWFERHDAHLVVKWIRLSMCLHVSQFGLLMAVLFGIGLL